MITLINQINRSHQLIKSINQINPSDEQIKSTKSINRSDQSYRSNQSAKSIKPIDQSDQLIKSIASQSIRVGESSQSHQSARSTNQSIDQSYQSIGTSSQVYWGPVAAWLMDLGLDCCHAFHGHASRFSMMHHDAS